MAKTSKGIKRIFDKFSTMITKAAGRPAAFVGALMIVIVWACTGPLFGFSDTWQLVINTGTTVITFLMVFIIQQSQNKDTMAVQLKLNELIAANSGSSNRLIDIEDLTEEELMVLKKFYMRLSKLSAEEDNIHATHSIDEAMNKHEKKRGEHPSQIKKKSNTGTNHRTLPK